MKSLLRFKPTRAQFIAAAIIATSMGLSYAAVTIPNSFTAGTPAVAAQVNENFTAVANQMDVLPGTLATVLGNNVTLTGGVTGYVNVISNYTPATNAKALVLTRCSADASAAAVQFAHRVAVRSPTATGTVVVGTQFYHYVETPAANVTVLNVNNDTFDLLAGTSYDFGVNYASPVPSGGTGFDYCSAVVLVFRQ